MKTTHKATKPWGSKERKEENRRLRAGDQAEAIKEGLEETDAEYQKRMTLCAKCGGSLPNTTKIYTNKRHPVEFMCSHRCQVLRRKDPR